MQALLNTPRFKRRALLALAAALMAWVSPMSHATGPAIASEQSAD
jgi:hypothetical protein